MNNVARNLDVFVGCSEISKSVTVKHMQLVGIDRAFCLPGWTCWVFQCLGGQKKLLGCGLLGRDLYPSSVPSNQKFSCKKNLSFFKAVLSNRPTLCYPMNSTFQWQYIFIRFMFLMEHFLLTFPVNYQNVYDHQSSQGGDML